MPDDSLRYSVFFFLFVSNEVSVVEVVFLFFWSFQWVSEWVTKQAATSSSKIDIRVRFVFSILAKMSQSGVWSMVEY